MLHFPSWTIKRQTERMIPVSITGVRVELPSTQPVVLVGEIEGNRQIPIWIGAPEASAIAMAQQGIETERPLTHDLFINTLAATGVSIDRVEINRVEGAVFYSSLVLSNGSRIDARTSDALALSVRAGAPVFCDESVMEETGIVPERVDDDVIEDEEKLKEFREFLDTIDPEDFAS